MNVNQFSFVKRYPGQRKQYGGTQCSRCDQPRVSGRYCRKCRADYMRAYRAKPEWDLSGDGELLIDWNKNLE